MATRHGAVQSLTGGARSINPLTGLANPVYDSAHSAQGVQQSANRDALPFFVLKQPGQPAYQPPPPKPVRQSYEESLTKPPSQPAEHSAIVRRLADRDAKIPAKEERVIPQRAAPETSIVHMHSPPPWGTTELVITSPRGRSTQQLNDRAKHATVSSLAADNTLERQLDQITRVIEAGQTTISIDNQSQDTKRALLHMMLASSQPQHRSTAQQIKRSQTHKKSSSKSKGESGHSSRNRSKIHSRRNSLPNAAAVLSSSLRALSPPAHAAGQRPRGAEAVNYVKATSNAHGGERFGGLSSTVNLSHPVDFVAADVGVKRGVATEVRARVNRAFQEHDAYDAPDPLSEAISSYVSRASTATHTRATTGTHTQATTGTHTQATTGTHTAATTGYHTPTEYSGAATPRPQQSWGLADVADSATVEPDVPAAPIVSGQSREGAWANRTTPRPASAAAPTSGRVSGKATPRTSHGHGAQAQVQAQPQSSSSRSGTQTPLAATMVRPISASASAQPKSQSHTPRPSPSVAAQQQQAASVASPAPASAPVAPSSPSVNRPASSYSLREQRSASKPRIPVSQDMPTAGRASHVLVPVTAPVQQQQQQQQTLTQQSVPIQSHGPAHQGHLTAMYQQSSSSPRGAQRPVTMASLLSPGYVRESPAKAATPAAAASNGTNAAATGTTTPAAATAATRLFTSPPSAHASANASTPARAAAAPAVAAPSATTPSRQSQIDMLQSQLARLQGELRGIHSQANSGMNTPSRKAPSSAPGSQTARPATAAAGDSAALHPVVALPLGGLLVSATLGNTASGFVPSQPAPKISGYGRVVSSGGMDESFATSTAQHLDAHVMSDARPPAGTLTKKHKGVNVAAPTASAAAASYSIAHPPAAPARFHPSVSSTGSFAGASLSTLEAEMPQPRNLRHQVPEQGFVHPDDEAAMARSGAAAIGAQTKYRSTNNDSGGLPAGGPLLAADRMEAGLDALVRSDQLLWHPRLGAGSNDVPFYQSTSIPFASPIPEAKAKAPVYPKLWKV